MFDRVLNTPPHFFYSTCDNCRIKNGTDVTTQKKSKMMTSNNCHKGSNLNAIFGFPILTGSEKLWMPDFNRIPQFTIFHIT